MRSNAGRMLMLATVSGAVMGLALLVGATGDGPGMLRAALADPASPEAVILFDLRLPRVLLAFVVGSALGLCGAALQALVRNPLADPYLLGLSGGAGLGAVAAIALEPAATWAVPLAAFVGALGAITLVFRLSVVASRRLDPRVLVLAGVVVGSFAAALMSALITLAPATQLRNAFLWLLGGFGSASWQALGLFVVYAVLPTLLLLAQARRLDLFVLGDEPAQALGADIERTKRVVYFAASLLTAAAVAVSGIIGFVGLVVPHAMRRIVGPLHLVLLPATMLVSGAFLVLADALARTAVRPMELPVGVVTALVGVPVFALLLRRGLR